MNKKGKREWDESESVIGRNASLGGGWHVPRILRLIESIKSFHVYIYEKGLTESIYWLGWYTIK